MRLISSALTVVASVVLATDPLSVQPFGKSWPLTGPHFQPISRYVLDVVQAVAVAAVLVSAGTAAARARSDPRWRAAMTAAVPVGLAVLMTVALRLSLPARAAYPLLSMLAAALVWFGASRVGEPPWRAARRDDGRAGRRDGVRDGRGRYRSGDRPDDDYWPDEAYRPADDYGSDGQYATGQYATYGRGRDPGRRVNSGPQPPMPQWQDRHRASAAAGAGEAALAGAGFGPQAGTGGSPAATPARPYGRILIFTLLENRVADFDRLAEQAAEEVRTGEPDTLVYVIHLVPNAPLQRIFYEIYRDRAAFESHESQPYMQRFVAERRTCVLATNVIELRLKYAKVAPLPNPQASAPVPPVRPQRPDQRWPDQPRPDQQRPDQRQVPSGRHYRG